MHARLPTGQSPRAARAEGNTRHAALTEGVIRASQ